MISATNVKYKYPNAEEIVFPNVQLSAGEQMLLLGKSGSGKTTYLHILSGLLKPKHGEVSIDNTNVYSLSGSQLDLFRGKNIGLIFQVPHFLKALSVKENLLLAQRLAGKTPNIALIEAQLKELQIADKLNKSINNLSQGEKQRVSIARAMINNPAVILADEPTSALDDENCMYVLKLLKAQAEKKNAALIIVTHDNRLYSEFENKTTLQ